MDNRDFEAMNNSEEIGYRYHPFEILEACRRLGCHIINDEFKSHGFAKINYEGLFFKINQKVFVEQIIDVCLHRNEKSRYLQNKIICELKKMNNFHAVPTVEQQKEATKEMNMRIKASKVLESQIGGEHYKNLPIQPMDYIYENGLGFAEGAIIKYVSRYKAKNGLEDLKKAKHFLDYLIEKEEEK